MISLAEISRLAPIGGVNQTAVHLPSDNIRGRVIGHNGRNLARLQALTGAAIDVTASPYYVWVRSADASRREIAHVALQRLVSHGHIHPARIDQTVDVVAGEMLIALKSIRDTRSVGTLSRYAWQGGPTVSTAAKNRISSIVGEKNLYAALAAIPRVDFEQGIIRNIPAMTAGSAKGHGFTIDVTSLNQLMTALSANGSRGMPMRFKHPKVENGIEADTLGNDVGYFVAPRVTNEAGIPQVRGDAYINDYASALPGQGDVRSYLLAKADSDPGGFGLSAVIAFDCEVLFDSMGEPTALAARINDCPFIDFVGAPAANPNGLLGARHINILQKGFANV